MRNQKSKSNVVCSFVVGALCLIFGITMGILIYIGVLIYENKVTNILEWGTYIILAAFGLSCLGVGVFNLIRYKITKNVCINGKKSIATISDYKTYRGRYKPIHFMCVEYKGESGKSYLNRFSFSFDNLNDYPIGTKIECMVYGEDCYVNPKHIVKVEKYFE